MSGRRLRRWALVLVAILLAVVALATFGPSLLNLERYRTVVARQAGRAIGRDVTVGSIRASIWGLGAEAQDIRVSDRAGFGAAPFVEADAMHLRVELLPLLRGTVRVATAVLERPRIHLVRDKAGRWNLEDLLAPAGPPAGPPAGRPSTEPHPGTPRPAAAGALLVRHLAVRAGELQLEDRYTAAPGNPPIAVKNLRLDIRQSEGGDAVDLDAAGELAGGKLHLASTLAPKGSQAVVDARLTVKGFDLAALAPYLSGVAASGPADVSLAAKGAFPALDVTADVNLTPARIDVAGSARKAPGEDARLSLAGRMVGDGLDLPTVRLHWRGAQVQGRAALARLRPLEMTFAATSSLLDLDHLLASPPTAQPAEGKTGSAPLFGAGMAWAAAPPASAPRAQAATAAAPAGAARADGTIRAAAVRWRGLEAGDVECGVAYRDAILAVRNLKGVLGGGRLSGAATVDLRGRRPVLAGTARLEEAQLKPLVAAVAKDKKVEAQGVLTADITIASTLLDPGSALGSIAGHGSVQVRDGRVAGYKPLERLSQTLASAAGGLQLLKARLDEFQRLTGTYTIDKGVARTKDLTLVRPDGQATAAGSFNLLDTSLNFDVAVRLGKVSLEAKVLGTTADPMVVPTVARLDKRFDMEIDRALKGDRGKKVQDLLRNLLR